MRSKKSHINSAYQRHINFLKAVSVLLLCVSIATVLIITAANSTDLSDKQITLILWSLAVFTVGLVIGFVAMQKQSTADKINEHLYALWRYNPATIYRFYRTQCRYEKKTVFFSRATVALILGALGVILFFNPVVKQLGIIAFSVAAVVFVYALCALPFLRYLLLMLRTVILGDAKEIIFSRSGIWYCGKVYYFGDRCITYHRVERKELHGMDAIVFYYTETHGFAQTANELAIPISPKLAYAADELVAEFNRSDLLEYNEKKTV